MTDLTRKDATDNEVSAFQRLWGTYKKFADDVIVADEPLRKSTAQMWRLRNSIPADYDWIIAERAWRRGLFRTHYAALKALNDLPGRLRKTKGDGE